MGVSGQLHAPAALLSGKELLLAIGKEAGWGPKLFWTRWRTEKFLPLAGIVQPVA